MKSTSRKQPKISVIVLYYNAKEYIDQLFPSLQQQTYKNYEVIVVDNASSDDGLAYIKKKYPWAKTIQNKQNLGFSEGNNVALRKAKGDILVLVNHDVVLLPHTLSLIAEAMQSDEKIGILGGPYIYLHAKDKVKSADIIKILNHDLDVHMVSGSLMAIKKEIIKKIGLLDKEYFLYWEDADFCYRAIQAGFRVLFKHDLIYYHASGGSTRIREEASQKSNLLRHFSKEDYFITYLFYRNEMMFSLLNEELFSFFRRLATIKMRVLYHLFLRFNKIPLLSFYLGLAYLFCHRKELLKIRAERQRKRTVSDNVIKKLQREKDWYAKKIRALQKS